MFKRGSRIVIAGIVLLAVLEGIFRMLPVSNGYFLDTVNAEQPIARRVSNMDAVTSTGWLMRDSLTRRVNDAGFLNAVDYRVENGRPIIALIGDSQIEAPALPEPDTIHGLLRAAFGSGVSFHTYAMSGAPLTQYAVWARHAREIAAPSRTIIFLSENDFEESFDRFGLFPGFHYARPLEGAIDVALRPYERGFLGIATQHSDLLAYLAHNLDIKQRLLGAIHAILPKAAARWPDGSITEQEADALLNWFFEEIDEGGLDGMNTMFVLNPPDRGYREATSCDGMEITNPFFLRFAGAARARGFLVADAAPAFCARHRDTGEILEIEDGVHWNGAGHAAMADLTRTIILSRWADLSLSRP